MVNPILPIAIVIAYGVPHVDLHAISKDPLTCLRSNPQMIIIADSHAGEDPHGPDPHGDDPHDEYHDKGLPANQEKKAWKAPKEPYPGDVPNTKEPHQPF
jgi:hypothetical protein